MDISNTRVRQTTIARPCFFEGIGVHSGRNAQVTLYPSEADQGYVFRRLDCSGGPITFPGTWRSVRNTRLCTVIGSECGEAAVSTVEHLLSALAGLGIDNVRIDVEGPEIPILDGSAEGFVRGLRAAGIVSLSAKRKFISVRKAVSVKEGECYAFLFPSEDASRIDAEILFETPLIGRQRLSVDIAAYVENIASARTFGFIKDVAALRERGFALGASLENSIAIENDQVLNPEGLRFSDEFVRHKILDSIGDLALAGLPLRGNYRSFCPGHALNYRMLTALFSDSDAYEVVEAEGESSSFGPPQATFQGRTDVFSSAPR